MAYSVGTSYDSLGRARTLTYPDGFAVTNSYNGYGYLSQVQRSDVGGSTIYWTANSLNAAGDVTNELLGNQRENREDTRNIDSPVHPAARRPGS